MTLRSRGGSVWRARRTRVLVSDASYARSGVGVSGGTQTSGSITSGGPSGDDDSIDVDSMVLMRTMVRPRRASSVPTRAARSARDGSEPVSRRRASRAASSSRR